MKKIAAALLAVILVLSFTLPTFAAYPKSDSYIYDGADNGTGILSADAESRIKSISDSLYVSKGYRIAVCTVDDTDGATVENYALGVFGEWKVAGVLILLVKNANTYYAVQSNSLTDTLSDAKLDEILSTKLEGEFARGDYGAGVCATAEELSSFINANASDASASNNSSSSGASKVGKFFKGLGIFILIVAILAAIGYGVLVYLEKKKEYERRLMLEEKRRRLAQSGRGNYYGVPSGNRGAAPSGSQNRHPSGSQGRYQSVSQNPGNYRNTYDQRQRLPRGTGYENGVRDASAQNDRRGDRFVYPDQSQSERIVRMQSTGPVKKNTDRPVRTAPPRGQRVDFDKEYYSGTSVENVDTSATREFTRH